MQLEGSKMSFLAHCLFLATLSVRIVTYQLKRTSQTLEISPTKKAGESIVFDNSQTIL
jgi:hypothetical protein